MALTMHARIDTHCNISDARSATRTHVSWACFFSRLEAVGRSESKHARGKLCSESIEPFQQFSIHGKFLIQCHHLIRSQHVKPERAVLAKAPVAQDPLICRLSSAALPRTALTPRVEVSQHR